MPKIASRTKGKAISTRNYGVMVNHKRFGAIYADIFKHSVIPAIYGQLYKNAEMYVQAMKETILAQRYNWAELSDKYAEWKIRQSHQKNPKILPPQPRILIATGKYLDAIGAWRGPYGQVYIGFQVQGKEEREALNLLAKWLEFGTIHMPARPHWRPVVSMMKRRQHTTKQELGEILYKKLHRAKRSVV